MRGALSKAYLGGGGGAPLESAWRLRNVQSTCNEAHGDLNFFKTSLPQPCGAWVCKGLGWAGGGAERMPPGSLCHCSALCGACIPSFFVL